MSLISKTKIVELMGKNISERLIISPILSDTQIGSCTVDLRLGTIFKVDKRTRTPVFDPVSNNRPIETFFDTTYRDVGESFILYPNQLVVASTLEYIRIPKNYFGEINTRSSFNRLGISFNSIIQPGYAGIVSLELINNSMNPIELYPGIRIIQLKLFELDSSVGYEKYSKSKTSKYKVCSSPQLSGLSNDKDLKIIESIKKIPLK